VTYVGEFLAVASLLLFSANALVVGPAARRLPQDLGILLGLTSNVVLGAVVVAGLYVLTGPGAPMEWDAVGMFAVGGLLTSYLGRWFFTRSLLTIGPTRASAVQLTNPFFAAVAGWVLLGEALGPVAVLCGLAVLAGVYLTSRRTGAGRAIGAGIGHRALSPTQLGPGLLGAVAYGLGNVARGAGVRDWEAPIVGSLIGAVAGLLAYALVNTDLRKLAGSLRGADPVGRRMWLLSGFLSIGAQTCLIAATLYIPVAIAVIISVATPVVLLPVSVLFLRRTEAVGVSTAVGALLVLAGVAGLVLS
jgi:drug/metabolite transporter (DMT)-like permease